MPLRREPIMNSEDLARIGNYRLIRENCRYGLDMEGFWTGDKSLSIAVSDALSQFRMEKANYNILWLAFMVSEF
jgi:hypothetical protein